MRILTSRYSKRNSRGPESPLSGYAEKEEEPPNLVLK